MAGEQRVPSYEELVVLVAELRAELAAARERIVELEALVAKNSRNSSVPPSSEGLAKPAPKSLRKRGGRGPGGQKGHGGSTLRQVEVPDEVVRHEPGCCGGCGGRLGVTDAEVGVEARQVFDIPPPVVCVTEHRLVARRCGCGAVTKAEAPAGVDAPVQYGPSITAVIVYLYVGQFLSKKRTAQALGDLFGVPLSSGTVASATKKAAAGLGGVVERVRFGLARARLVHFDETGFRVEGRLRWVHSACSAGLSLITVHDKRGVEAMDAAGVLPDFTGTAVHDAWAPYDTYTGATHALCNAHLLRELVAVEETAADPAWATAAIGALMELKNATDTARTANLAAIDGGLLDQQTNRFTQAALVGIAVSDTTTMGKKHAALARRMRDRTADYLRFAHDLSVPFDNNPAERQIRMIRLRQKVSGCMRTLTGAQHFTAIRTYTATATKQGKNLHQALRELAEGNPWQPEISP